MFSAGYYDSIERCKDHHKKSKNWSGKATFQYAEQIKKLVDKHSAKTLLDYGCGKGSIYDETFDFKINGTTFNKYLEIDSYFLYDPCVERLDKLPPENSSFDAVIAIQCLTAVPDDDFDTIVNYLNSVTNKFCFIGNSNLDYYSKSKKTISDQQYFKEIRSYDWWQNKFSRWSNSELILYFLPN